MISISFFCFLLFLSLWFVSLFIVIYHVRYPDTCSAVDVISLSESNNLCFEPLLRPQSKINITINFIQIMGQSDTEPSELDCKRNQALLIHEMIIENIENNIKYIKLLNFSVFQELNSSSSHIWGCIWISPELEENMTSKDSIKIFTTSKLSQLKLIHSIEDKNYRNLLSTGNSTNNIIDSTTAKTLLIPFWRYAYLPLKIRLVNFDYLNLKGTIYKTTDGKYYDTLLDLPYLGRRLNTVYVRQVVTLEDNTSSLLRKRMYLPIIEIDDISLLDSHQFPMYRKESLNFTVEYIPTSPLVYGYKLIVRKSLEMISLIIQNSSELDDIKYWLSDERLYQYIWTQILTWIHILLEYLAFRDDWKFFVGRKSYRGYSFSSLLLSLTNSIIIFLYLADQQVSNIILFSIGKDIIYSTYKLYKVGGFFIQRVIKATTPDTSNIVCFHIVVLGYEYQLCSRKLEYIEDIDIANYDTIAILHVGLLLYPLIIGFSIYSLIFYNYKSWWSWMISSMANFVYLFGFLTLTPQLYINFKLKSVAHLPIKSFLYKIFNTFVDDIFAFWIIKSPLKYKLMTLRDDIIFLGFLYQWFIYPIDKSRKNEFGFQYEKNE